MKFELIRLRVSIFTNLIGRPQIILFLIRIIQRYTHNLYFEQHKFIKILIERQQIQEYNKRLSFSNTYKSSICQISEFGKVVESSSINNYCLCEQAIPKIGKTMFAFQMLSGTSIRIGIGFRDIIQKNNYQNCGFGFGSYLIRQDGYTFSHHNKDVDNKQLSFTFTSNDIIIMEVSIEHKYIKWTKQNNPFLILQQIDTSISQELYPCVNIYQSKLKIFDNIPNLQLK